jgi:hypothetical protein
MPAARQLALNISQRRASASLLGASLATHGFRAPQRRNRFSVCPIVKEHRRQRPQTRDTVPSLDAVAGFELETKEVAGDRCRHDEALAHTRLRLSVDRDRERASRDGCQVDGHRPRPQSDDEQASDRDRG